MILHIKSIKRIVLFRVCRVRRTGSPDSYYIQCELKLNVFIKLTVCTITVCNRQIVLLYIPAGCTPPSTRGGVPWGPPGGSPNGIPGSCPG